MDDHDSDLNRFNLIQKKIFKFERKRIKNKRRERTK